MEPVRREHKGHRIELRKPAAELDLGREGEDEFELLVDDKPLAYGRLPDGRYFLDEYAYDWHENLVDLAQSFIDYRDRADGIRRGAGPRGKR
jgi:hypothetical protein